MLAGRRALITGAGRGLGRAIAEELAAAGAQVVVSDIHGEAAQAVAAGIGGVAHACDVGRPADCEALVTAAVAQLGGLDVLVNNAGIDVVAPLAEMADEDFERVLRVNVGGVFHCTKHAVPALTDGGGAIVNIASAAGLRGCPLMGAYSASKSAVIRLTETLAVELRDAGVRANAICPGSIDTTMMARIGAEYERRMGSPQLDDHLARTQGGRYVAARDVARLAVFLSSDQAVAITGASSVIDHGASASYV
jgi:NAD(P)-dependent dehydrogenase (short-subunit alcohol dehydrogenase family)